VGPGDSGRRRVPYLGHQLAEYVIAAALIGIGVHATREPKAVICSIAGALALFALVSGPPLGIFKLVGRRLHLIGDLVFAAAIALSPLLYLHDAQPIPIVVSLAVALVLVRMSLSTEIVSKPRGVRGAAPTPAPAARAPVQAPAPAPAPAASAAGSMSAGEAAAAAAGRSVARVVALAKQSDVPTAAARSLGRATGHARRIGRAAKAARAAAATSGAATGSPPPSSDTAPSTDASAPGAGPPT
jgi:pyruvate/2-oxoglutarate dehydrogenase complex dihydrolipoamide acyltransferase (E2) component